MVERPKVVVLGGGFAGIGAVRALKDCPVEITLIDRRNFHLFQPLLYQVATGALSPSEISTPLRAMFSDQRNVRVLMGEASTIDPAGRAVLLTDGTRIEYDNLIVAIGSVTSYFGHDEWREYARCLKTIEDAISMRGHIFNAFEHAELEGAKGDSPWLSFVIVGGGATGVELAGALSEIARKTLRDDFRSIRPEYAQLTIVDQAPRVLQTFSERLSRKAEEALLRLGVRVRSGVRVTDIDEDGVTISMPDGSTRKLASKTVLWAGGIALPEIVKDLAKATGAPVDNRNRIQVLPDLTIPGHPEIFVTGDVAVMKDATGRTLPGVAQVAMQQGRYAGKTIGRRVAQKPPLAPFKYSDRGDIAVIGRASAVANIFGHEVWGWPAWLIWVFIHLMYLVEFQNRVIVLVRWAFQYLAFTRGARLITGPEIHDEAAVPHPVSR